MRYLMAETDGLDGAGGDPAPASPATSARTLDDLPFPDLGEQPGVPEPEGGSADEGSAETPPDAPETPADAPEGLPFEGDEELHAFLDVYGDRLQQHPAMQEWADRRAQSRLDRALAERDALPQNDQRYLDYQRQEDEQLISLSNELGKISDGEQPDAQAIALAALAAREAGDRRRDVAAQRHADAAVLQVTTDLNKEAGRDLFTKELRDRYAEADQLFNRMQSAREDTTRERALPEYYRRTLEIIRDAAIEHGRGMERAAQAKEQLARDRLLASNAFREAAARAGRTPEQPDARPQQRPALTRETLSAGSWRDFSKLLESAGEKVNA